MKLFICDKDPAFAAQIAAALQAAGYTNVAHTSRCEDAKDAIVASGGTDLLITDVIMEGMDGFTLRESLAEIFPSQKTIFLSEYDLSDYAERIGELPVFYKPFEVSLLVDYVRQWCPLPATAPAATPTSLQEPSGASDSASSPESAARDLPHSAPSASEEKTAPASGAAAPVSAPTSAEPQPGTVGEPAAPKAVPAASPVPAATTAASATSAPATAVPKAAAVPATPAAVPSPVPVAKPAVAAAPQAVAVKATPSAPAAVPTPAATAATPSAQPATPVAKPVPVAAKAPAAAVPAVKAAVPAVATAAVPKPQPAAADVPAPKAQAAAARPAAVAGAKPAAVPAATAAAAAPKVPAFPEVELPPDSLVGKNVGDYLIEAKIGETSFAGIYRAHQKNMNRKVRFYALDTKTNPPAGQIEKFRQDAVAKARVKQPFILSLYEAGEADGVLFYSAEYLPGRTLEQLAQSGQKLDGLTALQVLKTTADALHYLQKNSIPHNPLSGRSILLTGTSQVRLANIACAGAESTDSSQSAKTLAGLLLSVLAPEADTAVPGLSQLLTKIQSGEQGASNWEEIRQAANAITPQSRIADADKLEAKEIARRKALEEAKKRQRRSVLLTGLTSFSLLAIGFAVLYWALFLRGSSYKQFDRMIEIPGGPFIYQDGETVTIPTFWIAEHPVTIGQYAEFLDWLRKNPDRIGEVMHPDAPKGKNFIPTDWADSETIKDMPGYYTRAKRWGRHRSVPLNLDSPVFGVDYFDAWGYAKWRGMRLPTEQEWEKAARGTQGFLYPWGNEPRHEWVNSGNDFNPNPEKGGEIDGWKRWNPVDAMRRDRSPFGVMGMAGNVSEWTDSWDESERFGMKVPVIRGGNYQNPDYRLTRRILLRMPFENDEALGFRLASSVPPDQVKPLQ